MGGEKLDTKEPEIDMWSYWGASRKTEKKSAIPVQETCPPKDKPMEICPVTGRESEDMPPVELVPALQEVPTLIERSSSEQEPALPIRGSITLAHGPSNPPAPETHQKAVALLKIDNGDTAPVSRGSVLVTLEAPVSQTSIILHAMGYVSKCPHSGPVWGRVRSVIFDGCEVGLQVDDRGLTSIVDVLTLKPEIPTFFVELGL
jgi:hypothetical protein